MNRGNTPLTRSLLLLAAVLTMSLSACRASKGAPRHEEKHALRLAELHAMQGERREGWPITDVTFSPDGRTLAAANHFDARTWEAATGKLISRLSNERDGQILAVRFVGGGKHILVASSKSTCIWDWAQSKRVGKAPAAGTPLSVSADGSLLLAGMKLWQTAPWKLLRTFSHPHKHTISALSPDGKYVAVGEVMLPRPYPAEYKAPILIYNAKTGKLVKRLEGFVWILAFSPDSKRLAAAQGQSINLWDVASGKQTRACKTPDLVPLCLAFSPDGRLLAAGGYSGQTMDGTNRTHVCLWDIATGNIAAQVKGGRGSMLCVAYSPDGKQLAAGDSKGLARIWALLRD